MGNAIWQNSLLYRLVQAVLSCCRSSILARFWPFWARQYSASRFRSTWERLLGAAQDMGRRSLVSRISWRFGEMLHRWGAALSPAWDRCLPARAVRALRGSAWLRGSAVGRTLLSLKRGDLLLLAFGCYLPIDYLLREVIAQQTLAAYWDEGFLIACVVLVLLWKMSPKQEVGSDVTPMDGFLLFFLGLGVLLVGVVSPIMSVAVSGYRAVFQYMLWFFVVVRVVRTRHAVRLLYTVLVLLGAALALHGIYQFAVGTPIPRSWVSVYEMGVRTRVFSIVGSPNIMGCLMVMLAPLAAGLAYVVKKTGQKLLCWAAVGAMCLACVFTFSRGAWVGLAAAVLLFSLLRDRRLLLVAGGVGVAALFSPQVMGRITFLFTSDFVNNNETAGRAARWATGIDLLMRNDPVFGFGLGRFGGAVAMQNKTVENIRYFYMDNYYLKTLVEMGYVGLGGYLLLLAGLLWNGLRALFRVKPHNEYYSLACGLMSSLVGVLVHCYFENIFEVPYMNAYFWGMSALLMVIGFKLNAARGVPMKKAH